MGTILDSIENYQSEEPVTFQDQREPVIVYYDIDLDDAGLTPYEFRAYQRIVRRCAGARTGNCFESLQRMAKGCAMSRAQLARAISVLIERRMIARVSKAGGTSHYVLLDKSKWVSLEDWRAGKAANPSPPETGGVSTRAGGVSLPETGGVSTRDTKNTKKKTPKENKEEHTLSAGAGAREGNDPSSKKSPKLKPEPKSPSTTNHPMVVLYRDVTEYHKLKGIQCDKIALEVEDEQMWRFVLEQRALHGWFRGNVAGALQDYHQLKRGVAPTEIYPSLIDKEHTNGGNQKRDRNAHNAPRRESRAERNERLARQNLAVVFGQDIFNDAGPGGVGFGEEDAGGPVIDIGGASGLSARRN